MATAGRLRRRPGPAGPCEVGPVRWWRGRVAAFEPLPPPASAASRCGLRGRRARSSHWVLLSQGVGGPQGRVALLAVRAHQAADGIMPPPGGPAIACSAALLSGSGLRDLAFGRLVCAGV